MGLAVKVVEALGVMLDALGAELEADGSKGEMCLFTILPGNDVAIDYALEDCAGMGWIRLTSAAPSVRFPNPDLTVDNCAYSLAYGIEMGVLRGAPVPDSFGNEMTLPTADEQFECASLALDDMEAMHRALRVARKRLPEMLLGSYLPSGPEGGAVGGVWTATIGLDL